MSISSLYKTLKDNNFDVVIHKELIKKDIYKGTKYGHVGSLIVSNPQMLLFQALLAYELTVTPHGILVSYYNKHILREELGLVYTILHKGSELLNETILQHAIKTSKSLISLAESNKDD